MFLCTLAVGMVNGLGIQKRQPHSLTNVSLVQFVNSLQGVLVVKAALLLRIKQTTNKQMV